MTDSTRYGEIFEIEAEGWCYGIQNYPGEIFPALVHAVVREMGPWFLDSIQNGYVFDPLKLGADISKAAKYLIHEKEVAFSIVAQLPHPSSLNETEQFVMAQIVDKVEKEYGGVIDRLQRKWFFESKRKEAA